MIFREFIIKEDEGVFAVSLVSDPANESMCMVFGRAKKDPKLYDENGNYLWYKFTAAPAEEIIETSHAFCKIKAGHIFHTKEIRKWSEYKDGSKYQGFIKESNTLDNFPNDGFNGHTCLYNCRHNFVAVQDIREIPQYKIDIFCKEKENETRLEFSSELFLTKEEKTIKGVILRPGQLIYRTNVDGFGQNGYGWFSKDTILKMKNKYGLNKSVTLQHSENITGALINTDSWIYNGSNDNCGIQNLEIGSWCMTYKVISDKIWRYISTKGSIGFSIEAWLSVR